MLPWAKGGVLARLCCFLEAPEENSFPCHLQLLQPVVLSPIFRAREAAAL